jgi:hypothetical protein
VHEFEATVVHHFVGTLRYTVVYLPPEIAAELPLAQHPRLRISGEVGEVPFDGAWQPANGRWYLMLGKRLLKEAGLSVGDRTEVRFRVEDQDSVDVPADLQRAIDADPLAASAWAKLSPGKQRAWSHRVGSAKTGATRLRRTTEVVDKLRDGTAGVLMVKKPRVST